MYKNKKILAIIPARGGSKRVPKKNIVLLNGKPLIFYAIKAALDSSYIDRVVVSTDDQKIAKIAKQYGAEVPFLRPKRLAGDDIGPDYVVYQHAVKMFIRKKIFKPDIIVELQPTSPLRTAQDIDLVIKKLVNTLADTVVTLTPMYRFNGAVLAVTYKQLMDKNNDIGADARAVIMPTARSIDIDEPIDMVIAEILLKKYARNN